MIVNSRWRTERLVQLKISTLPSHRQPSTSHLNLLLLLLHFNAIPMFSSILLKVKPPPSPPPPPPPPPPPSDLAQALKFHCRKPKRNKTTTSNSLFLSLFFGCYTHRTLLDYSDLKILRTLGEKKMQDEECG
ncbi:hypothetical protein Dimus_025346 [Dionaea muscipula]